jgi:hypothetical protein
VVHDAKAPFSREHSITVPFAPDNTLRCGGATP